MDIRQWGFFPSISLMIILLSSCNNSLDEKLIGEWTGSDTNGEMGSFLFNEDGTCMWIMGNEVFPYGSSTTEDDHVDLNLTWEIDDTHDPIHLDCIFSGKDPESGKLVKLYLPLIFRFIGENKIQIRWVEDLSDVNFDQTTSQTYIGKRPIGFSKSGVDNDQMIFTRQ